MSDKIEEPTGHSFDSLLEKVGALTKTPTTRRGFLKLGLGGMGAAGIMLSGCDYIINGSAPAKAQAAAPRIVFVENATGMVLGQPTLCVGCRRCEIACTDYNLGKTQPSIANVKVNRNYTFGPRGAGLGLWRGEGTFGNLRIVQDTCRQCPHPVPCLDACPYGAIEVVPPANARVINTEKCKGCRTCQRACPFGMTSFDENTKKAQKCHLCNGKPECAKACPTGALTYVPWEDRTKTSASRFVVPVSVQLPKSVADSCVQCH
jgi:Fe-S-cluster-containing dehydrogenase component